MLRSTFRLLIRIFGPDGVEEAEFEVGSELKTQLGNVQSYRPFAGQWTANEIFRAQMRASNPNKIREEQRARTGLVKFSKPPP